MYEIFKKDGKYNWFLTSVPVFVVYSVGGKADKTSGPDQAKVCRVKPTKHRTFTGYKAFSNWLLCYSTLCMFLYSYQNQKRKKSIHLWNPASDISTLNILFYFIWVTSVRKVHSNIISLVKWLNESWTLIEENKLLSF